MKVIRAKANLFQGLQPECFYNLSARLEASPFQSSSKLNPFEAGRMAGMM